MRRRCSPAPSLVVVSCSKVAAAAAGREEKVAELVYAGVGWESRGCVGWGEGLPAARMDDAVSAFKCPM